MIRLAPIAPVLLGVLIAQVALGIMTPLIPLLLLHQGVATETIGVVASAYFLGFLTGTQTVQRIVAAVGHIRAFAVFAACGADAALLLLLTGNPWSWAALRFLIGFAMAGLFLVAESWLNDRATKTTRGRVFGAYLVVSWGGSALGPFALNVVAADRVLFAWVAFAFTTALLPMALTHQSNPEIGRRERFSLLRLFRASPLGVVACTTSGLVNSSFYALTPVYLRAHGHPAGDVSLFISAAMLAALLVQFPVGQISDAFGRRPVTLAALILAMIAAATLGWAGRHSFPALLALGAIYAGLTAPLYGLGAGQTNDNIPREEFVGASGGLLFAWALGSSLGPTLAATTMAHLGPSGLFTFLATVLFAVAGFTVTRMALRAAVPLLHQTGYVPTPAAPANVAELDPRTASNGVVQPATARSGSAQG
ncbi:MAG TPA: MFS transporter [Acetobacteraceae bacterium]|nr:MFS transporter [Acetobacteraceae bacterium]